MSLCDIPSPSNVLQKTATIGNSKYPIVLSIVHKMVVIYLLFGCHGVLFFNRKCSVQSQVIASRCHCVARGFLIAYLDIYSSHCVRWSKKGLHTSRKTKIKSWGRKFGQNESANSYKRSKYLHAYGNRNSKSRFTRTKTAENRANRSHFSAFIY